MPTNLAEALAQEIKRVSEKKARWVEYMRTNESLRKSMGLGVLLMQAAIDEAVTNLALGEAVAMMQSYEALKAYSDDD